MKKFFFCLIVTAACMNALPGFASGSHQVVEMTEVGTLEQIITERDPDRLDSLTVVGPVNGADIAYICKGSGRTALLEYIDLSEVTLVPSDDVYASRSVTTAQFQGETISYSYVLSDRNEDVLVSAEFRYRSYKAYRNDLSYAFFKNKVLKELRLPKAMTSVGEGLAQGCGTLEKVLLPDHTVEIGNDAFEGNNSSLECALPQSVEIIGDDAFSGSFCRVNVGALLLPNIRKIGYGAFRNCEIRSLSFGDGLEEIGREAFYGSSLEGELELPSSLKSFGAESFGYTGLVKVVLNEGITEIPVRTFAGCGRLADVVIPQSVKIIGREAFEGTPFLASVPDENGIVYIGSTAYARIRDFAETDVAFRAGTRIIADGILSGCGNLESVTFPPSLETIGSDAFSGCGSLESVTFPPSLETIGDGAFSGCGALREIGLPEGLKRIGSGAFSNCSKIATVTIPESVELLGGGIFNGCAALYKIRFNAVNAEDEDVGAGYVDGYGHASSFLGTLEGLERIELGTRVRRIPKGLYSGRDFAPETLPENLEYIGDCAFNRNTAIRNLVFPDGIKEIGNDAFYDCDNLESAVFPPSLDSIGEYAFRFCGALREVKFSEGLKYIGGLAFESCNIERVTIPSSLDSMGEYAFQACEALREITLSEGLRHFDANGAFASCSAVESVTFPSSLETIGDNAFGGLARLKGIALPKGLKYIGESAFWGAGIQEIVLPENVQLGASAFSGCTDLTKIVISDGVETVGEDAFRGDKNVREIYLSSTLRSIGDGAFYLDSERNVELQEGVVVTCRAPEPPVLTEHIDDPVNPTPGGGTLIVGGGNNHFGRYKGISTLYVPAESVELYKGAEGWNEFGTILPIDDSSALPGTKQTSAEGVTVYNLQGVLILDSDDAAALRALPDGIYIVNGRTTVIVNR